MTKEKSAEDWVKEQFRVAYIDDIEPLRADVAVDSMLVNWVKKIQRNAKHAAMLEAETLVQKEHNSFTEPRCNRGFKTARSRISESILIAAEKYKD